jgi:hypothetical protein
VRLLVINLAVVLVASAVFAQGRDQKKVGQSQAGTVDLTKMGPWTRKPSNEQQISKEITEFFNQEEQVMKKGDFNAAIARIDFPVFMATDDSRGTTMAREYSREEYVSMMKPMFESMPKDIKVTHKPNIHVLSDSLASIYDEFTMTTGQSQQKMMGRSSALLVKKDGRWMWKTMIEPGWGDMSATGAYGTDAEQQHMKKQQH